MPLSRLGLNNNLTVFEMISLRFTEQLLQSIEQYHSGSWDDIIVVITGVSKSNVYIYVTGDMLLPPIAGKLPVVPLEVAKDN